MNTLAAPPVELHASPDSRTRRALLMAALGAALAGCAAPRAADRPVERPAEPVTLAITLVPRNDTNPDVRGRPSPLAVRIFELRSAASFETADYFALYERDQATLGNDLVARVDFILKPGEQQEVVRRANAETRYLGVVAGYRDLERSIWRVVAPVALPGGSSSRRQRVRIAFERAAVRMDIAPAT